MDQLFTIHYYSLSLKKLLFFLFFSFFLIGIFMRVLETHMQLYESYF